MIRLVFTIGREPLQFKINNKEIHYTDRKWKSFIRCIPPDPDMVRIVLMSRNQIPKFILKLFKLTPEEQKEYDEAPDDKALSEIIKRDASLKGCKLQKEEIDGS